jgi:hypothetical protein
LTHDESFDIEPAWSRDESMIAYVQTRDIVSGRLRVIRADDGKNVPLPRDVVVNNKLHFDPNGKRILGNFRDANGATILAWFDLQSGELSNPLQSVRPRVRVAMSHDGLWLAWATTQDVTDQQSGNNGPSVDVWKMAADGGTPEKLVRFPARIYDLAWASDSSSLFVVTDLGGAHNDIWQLPLQDSERRSIKLTFGVADEDCPSVSHDGRWLLFTDNRHGSTALEVRDLTAKHSAWIETPQLDFRQPVGSMELSVVDKTNGKPATARVSVQQIGGKYYAPNGALYRVLDGEMHFYIEGHTTITLPSGRYKVQAARGPEYKTSSQVLEISTGETARVAISLERWTNQRERGWYSGESHIHANYGYGHWYNSPRTMTAQCGGEDLIICNLMVANSDGDGVFDREYFRGRPDPLSTPGTILYWNEEFRSTIWGHMTLLNLKQLVEPIFTGFQHTTNPHDHPTNADIADHTHDQDGHVNYTHPAQNAADPYLGAYTAKELPVDVALGKIDSIDVMGSNHIANMPVWYRLLNCGFRIPASAGTDCFLNRISSRLPGSDRAYVQVTGDFSYQRWIENLKAGKSFVTNGPILEFSANGKGLGETIKLDGTAEVQTRGKVTAPFPVDRVEIIHNGRVAATAPMGSDRQNADFDLRVSIEQSGWLALRVSGPRRLDSPRVDSFAHTSPIYVQVAGKPLDTRADAEYFLKWIDRLYSDVRLRNRIPPRHQVHVESQISASRSVYRKLAGQTE